LLADWRHAVTEDLDVLGDRLYDLVARRGANASEARSYCGSAVESCFDAPVRGEVKKSAIKAADSDGSPVGLISIRFKNDNGWVVSLQEEFKSRHAARTLIFLCLTNAPIDR